MLGDEPHPHVVSAALRKFRRQRSVKESIFLLEDVRKAEGFRVVSFSAHSWFYAEHMVGQADAAIVLSVHEGNIHMLDYLRGRRRLAM